MPLPSLLCLGFSAGVAAALAARAELRVNPRSAWLTRSFAAFALFVLLTLIPISVYFYVCHGDWFLLYFVDVRQIPSAVALLGFVIEAAIAGAGFWVGSGLIRNQHGLWVGLVLALGVASAVAILFIGGDRLGVVGSFAQYHGDFGLSVYPTASLLHGTVLMGGLLLGGFTYLLIRIVVAGRRGTTHY